MLAILLITLALLVLLLVYRRLRPARRARRLRVHGSVVVATERERLVRLERRGLFGRRER